MLYNNEVDGYIGKKVRPSVFKVLFRSDVSYRLQSHAIHLQLGHVNDLKCYLIMKLMGTLEKKFDCQSLKYFLGQTCHIGRIVMTSINYNWVTGLETRDHKIVSHML